jgi:hypothetical protein
MWGIIERQKDEDGKIVYRYSYESNTLDGLINYNPIDDTYKIILLSDNDKSGRWAEKVASFIGNHYEKNDLPKWKKIAIG